MNWPKRWHCREGKSKADFALAVAEHLGLSTKSATVGSSATIPGRAPRTKDLRMDVTRIERALDRAMPTLDQEIARL